MTKKSDFEISLEIMINLCISHEREAEYRGRLEGCKQNLQKGVLKLQEALKDNNSPINLRDQRPGSIGELTLQVYRTGCENDTLQEKLDSEIRYSKYLRKSWVDEGVQKLFEESLKVPFKEKRILLHNKKEGFLLCFASFPDGNPPKEFISDQKLSWIPVPNKIIPNLFSRVESIERYKPRDKVTHKADINTDHFPSGKKCDSCQRIFYTFTKMRQYCCDECGSIAYNNRRRNRRHEQGPKKVIVKELKLCPICNDEYHGRGRTCGKERCRKAEFRKRKKECM